MGKLYLITGPAGVGKSTVSKTLAESRNKCALIEGDEVYHFVKGGYVSPWKDGNHMEIFWKNSLNIISNFLEDDYDVVFNYIINKDELENIRNHFLNTEIKFILLLADDQVLISRDNERPVDCRMGERVLILKNQFINQNFDNKYILNTTNLSILETVAKIEKDDSYLLEV